MERLRLPEADHVDRPGEFYFQWHLTERCNRACLHCYQGATACPELPLTDLMAILARMHETLAKWELPGSLSLTGGEPFVRADELFSLTREIDGLPTFVHYDILTNGSLITADDASRLRELRKLRRVQLSLEGVSPETNDAIRGGGAFDETLAAIHLLKRRGLTVGVMTTISRSNAAEVPALIRFLDSEGVDTFALERLVPEGHGGDLAGQLLAPEELRDLYAEVYELAYRCKHLRVLMYRPLFTLVAPGDPTVGALCSVGNNALTIMPDGTVYPCRRLPIPIGNALRDGFFAIWYGSEVLWRARNPANLGGKCRDCEFLTACRGCRAMAYFTSGDYMAEEPQCWR